MFVNVTNKEVYEEIKALRRVVEEHHEETAARLSSIDLKQATTNGKVKKALWVATSAGSIALIALGYLFQHLSVG